MTNCKQGFRIDLAALKYFGFNAEDFKKSFYSLERLLGAELLWRSSCRGDIGDLGKFELFQERAKLLSQIENTAGFERVVRLIKNQPTSSLLEPHSFWFQLYLGCAIQSLDYEIEFEKKIKGHPKDILIFNESNHLECRAFSQSDEIKCLFKGADRSFKETTNQNNNFIGTVGPFKLSHLSLHGFAVTDQNDLKPSISLTDSLRTESLVHPGINEQRRLFDQLSRKYGQLIPGICNLFAIDCSWCTGDYKQTIADLSSTILVEENSDLSGLLIWRRVWDVHSVFPIFDIQLITNESASTPPPSDFAGKFPRRYFLQ